MREPVHFADRLAARVEAVLVRALRRHRPAAAVSGRVPPGPARRPRPAWPAPSSATASAWSRRPRRRRAAIKPQVAFFEALGGYGLTALERVCAAATELGVPVIADAKRGDIPSTAAAYAAAWLEPRPGGEPPLADALTVNPYLGGDSLDPFAAACDRAGGGNLRPRAHLEPRIGRPPGAADARPVPSGSRPRGSSRRSARSRRRLRSVVGRAP